MCFVQEWQTTHCNEQHLKKHAAIVFPESLQHLEQGFLSSRLSLGAHRAHRPSPLRHSLIEFAHHIHRHRADLSPSIVLAPSRFRPESLPKWSLLFP